MQNNYIETCLVIGVISLFIVAAIVPIGIGQNSNTINNDLQNLSFICFDKYHKFKYEKYVHEMQIEDDKLTECKAFKDNLDVLATCGPMDSAWPMQSHDTNHTGRSPYTTAGTSDVEKWRFETDGWIDNTPVIDCNGTIYFGKGWDVVALYHNGTEKWTCRLNGMIAWSSAAISDDGTIYVGSWDDHLYAINPNGTIKWRFCAYDNIHSSPAIADDGTIYFGTMGVGYRIYAINPNGTEKWNYQTGYKIISDPAIGDDGTVYIGSGDSFLYALYPNGTLRWRFETGDEIHSHPSISDDGTIYIASWDEYLYALYPNGTEKWRCHIGPNICSNPSLAENGTIYVGSNKLYAVYPNGTIRWSFELGSQAYIYHSSPAICADGIIYVGTHIGEGEGGDIIAVNPDGTEQWRKRIANNWVDSSPSIGEDGTVYIGSASDESGESYGYLHAFGWTELAADAHGPYQGIVGEPVQFTGSADGGYPPYIYHWDFGDEGTSEEQNPTHEYDTAGNYTVTLTVTDDNDSVAVDTTWALIIEENNPPSDPTITGETNGKFGELYDYSFVSTDPEDHDVFYYIDWGDGDTEEWIGPYESGEDVIRSHTWDDRGEYTIRAKAKDVFDAESDWAYLEVTMPVNQQTTHPWFHWFLERFPNAFLILRHLLGL